MDWASWNDGGMRTGNVTRPGWRWRLRRLMPLLIAGTLIGSGLTLVAFSVPLYRMFCAVTGFGGQTVRAERNTTDAIERTITVRFSTDVAPGLDWRFVPEQPKVTVRLGEQALVYFRAENRSKERIVGHATFNVAPFKAGPYFNKIQCFCFEEEALEPGETADMPVVFFVDPALASDPDTTELDTITLAYTFFRSPKPEAAAELSRFATSFDADGPPDLAHGKAIFESSCTACHALDKDRTGPRLGGVLGRTAGTVPTFAAYSPALKASEVIWSKDTLDRWLTRPADLVPGARMPFQLDKPTDRRDVIAFLGAAGEHAAHDRAGGTLTRAAAKGCSRDGISFLLFLSLKGRGVFGRRSFSGRRARALRRRARPGASRCAR